MQQASVAEGGQQDGLRTGNNLQQGHDQQEQLPLVRQRKPEAAVDRKSKRGKAAIRDASLVKISKKQPSKRKMLKVGIEKLPGGVAGLATAAKEAAK